VKSVWRSRQKDIQKFESDKYDSNEIFNLFLFGLLYIRRSGSCTSHESACGMTSPAHAIDAKNADNPEHSAAIRGEMAVIALAGMLVKP